MAERLPPRIRPRAFTPPRGGWEFFIRGWRPASGWLITLLLVRGLVVPLVQLARREPVEPIDWMALSALAGVMVVSRTYERREGIS
ncbi:hypothetical protein [Polymorphobacter sp.]|uniref:hypothetical protein n=1 Tax=Polymorphobacter sp. TaxID=1909290 RepID=UPI003F726EE3